MAIASSRFDLNSRRKIIKLPALTRPTGGGSVGIDLPKTGLLSAIYIRIQADVAGTLSAHNRYGFASLIKRIRVLANGAINLFDVSGPGYFYVLKDLLGTELIDQLAQSNFRVKVDTTADRNLDLYIPIAMQQPLKDPIGLFNLQSPGALVRLEIEWEADATVATGATVTVDTCQAYMEVFTVPVNQEDWPPLNIVHQVLEDQQSVVSGEVTYYWPKANVYLGVGHGLGIGEVTTPTGADGFTNVKLRANQSDFLFDVPPHYLDMESYRLRGRARYPGQILIDLMGTSGWGNYGSMRDLIDAARVTDLASVIQANASLTLFTIRRQLVQVG